MKQNDVLKCLVVTEMLDGLLDGRLGREQARRVRSHLRCCPGCRRRFKQVSERVPLRDRAAEPRASSASGGLRVLLAYTNPGPGISPGFEHLEQVPEYIRALKLALDPLRHGQPVPFLRVLANPSSEELRNELAPFNPHVLVFVGHNEAHNAGSLACVRGGLPDECRFPDLVAALHQVEEPALRLAWLLVCQSEAVALRLLAAGVPAVVTMLAAFPASEVPVFAEALFHALARFVPLSDAHQAACCALVRSGRPEVPQVALLPALWRATPPERLPSRDEVRFRALYREMLLDRNLSLLDVLGRKVALSSFYVDRTLVQEVKTRTMSAVDSGADGTICEAESPGAVRLQEVDLWKTLRQDRRVVLEGPPGTGKSTFCRWLVHELLQPEAFPWLPIYVPFRRWAEAWRRGRPAKTLDRYLAEDYFGWLHLPGEQAMIETPRCDGTSRTISAAAWLFDCWLSGTAVLVVDGLDEVFDPRLREEALEALASPTRAEDQAHVLLTTRPLRCHQIDDFTYIKLNDLDRKRIGRLVGNCARILQAPDLSEKFLAQLGRSEHGAASDLASRPGNLVGMVSAYVRGGVLPGHGDEVLELEVDDRLSRAGGVVLDPPLLADQQRFKRRVLEELAFHLLFCRSPGRVVEHGPMVNLIARLLGRVKHRDKLVLRDPSGQAATLLADLTHQSGLLQEIASGTPAGSAYEFASDRILQYLASCHLAHALEGPQEAGSPQRGEAERIGSIEEWFFGVSGTRPGASVRTSGLSVRYHCPVCRTTLEPLSSYLWRSSYSEVPVYLAGLLRDSTPLLLRLEREPDDLPGRMLALRARVLGRSRVMQGGVFERTLTALLRASKSESDSDSDTPSGRRLEALADVGSAPNRRFVDRIRSELIARLKERDQEVRWSAAKALGRLGDRSAVPELIAHLGDEADEVREAAAEALGRLGDRDSLRALIGTASGLRGRFRALLSWVRVSGAEALGRLRGTGDLPELLDRLDSPVAWVRASGAEALGRLGDRSAMLKLVGRLDDPDASVREHVARALGRLGDRSPVPKLIERLDDPNASVRERVAEALGRLGDRSAVPSFVNRLKHPDPRVRDSMHSVLWIISEREGFPIVR
jgi:hypothetical protein